MRHIHHPHSKSLYAICLLGFIFAMHMALPVYVNSTFLSNFASESTIGLIYTLSSILTIIGLIYFSPILRKFGNYKATLAFITIQVLALTGLALSNSLALVAPLFILSIALGNLIVINIDVFIEHDTNSKTVGSVRGLFLTITNTAWILSPMLAGVLLDGTNEYWKIYGTAVLLLLPALLILQSNFKDFKDPIYNEVPARATLHKIWLDPNLYRIFMANIILNLFYAWMIIYTPIYLHKHLGFDWEVTGFIFTIMLIPFVLLDMPLGRLADRKYGEKEMMSIGFVIMAISTGIMSTVDGGGAWLWALILFTTRIGASIIEIMIETYFFKKVGEKDANMLSMFRSTRSIAYIIAPAVFSLSLWFVDYRYTFIILGIICLYGLRYSLTIEDTL
jgi:MFS family permease